MKIELALTYGHFFHILLGVGAGVRTTCHRPTTLDTRQLSHDVRVASVAVHLTISKDP